MNGLLLLIISSQRKQAEIYDNIEGSILIVDNTEYIKAMLSHHTLSLFLM